MAKVWSGHGIEVHVNLNKAKKAGTLKSMWVRIQGEVGSTIRVYESLSYARSADLLLQVDPSLKPRKLRKSSP